jgi:hypothetical protein
MFDININFKLESIISIIKYLSNTLTINITYKYIFTT